MGARHGDYCARPSRLGAIVTGAHGTVRCHDAGSHPRICGACRGRTPCGEKQQKEEEIKTKKKKLKSPTPTPTPTPSPTPLPNKMIALTFDDGPYSPVTNRILNMLEQYHGHATFFVVGDRVNSYKDTVLRAMSLGCEIGNHTYDHKSTLTSMSASMVQWEISNCNAVVKNLKFANVNISREAFGDLL